MLTLTERKNAEKLLRLYVIIKNVLQIKLNRCNNNFWVANKLLRRITEK